MIKRTASYILFFLVFIVTLASANAAQEWFPQRSDLAVMSLRSAILVNFITLLLVGGIIYLITRAVQA